MNDYYLLYTEVNCISLVLIGLLLIKSREFRQSRTYKDFIYSVIFMILFISTDAISTLMIEGYLPANKGWILFIKSIYFSSATLMSYFWLLYFEKKTNTPLHQAKKIQRILQVIVIFEIITIIANLRHGFFFYISADGVYHRGVDFISLYFLCYLFIGVAIIRSLYIAIFQTNYLDKSYVITLVLFPVMPAIAGIIQYFYPQLPIACICITISTYLIYFNSVDELIFIDPLTGLNNRRNFMRIISHKMKSTDSDEALYLLMMDVDYFKQINDTYGHIEGDRALSRVSYVLSTVTTPLRKRPMLGRFGGDEFIALLEFQNEQQVKSYINTVQDLLKEENIQANAKYKLTLSIGYAPYVPEYHRVLDFINAADEHLYQVKKNRS